MRGAAAAGLFLFLVVNSIVKTQLPLERVEVQGDLTRAIGASTLTTFVLPFELLGVLLLVALIGASYFARPEE